MLNYCCSWNPSALERLLFSSSAGLLLLAQEVPDIVRRIVLPATPPSPLETEVWLLKMPRSKRTKPAMQQDPLVKMANASAPSHSVVVRCKYRSDLSRCDPLNTLFIPEGRGGRQRSPSAHSLIKLIMCELWHKGPHPSLSRSLCETSRSLSVSMCRCIISSEKLRGES